MVEVFSHRCLSVLFAISPLLNLLHHGFLVLLLHDHAICLLQGIHQRVDSPIQLVQEHFHVLLVARLVISLLVRVPLFGHIIFHGLTVLLRLLSLLVHNLVVTERIGILLLHETHSSLSCTLPNVLCSLWEQVTKSHELWLFDAHEENVGQGLLVALGLVINDVVKGLVHQVALQVEQDLEVTEVRVLR